MIENRLLAAVFYPLYKIRSSLGQLFYRFMASRSGPFVGTVELDRRRVYILPTRVGIIFTLLLFFLLLGSINYTKSLGFMLTFLLASLGIVSMLTTWRNLAGLRVTGQAASPVFAGQDAIFMIQLENPSVDQRYAITAATKTQVGDTTDVPPKATVTLRFRHATATRGYLDPGSIKLMTEFPLGFFVAWTWVDLSMRCLVYPTAAVKVPQVSCNSTQNGHENADDGIGLEDFAGLRSFQPGDSWRRVSWKATARSDKLYSKVFSGGQPELQWIDWLLIDEPLQEDRLSVMARMVLDAEQAGRHYGLRLPALEIQPDNGQRHKHQCLKRLALFIVG